MKKGKRKVKRRYGWREFAYRFRNVHQFHLRLLQRSHQISSGGQQSGAQRAIGERRHLRRRGFQAAGQIENFFFCWHLANSHPFTNVFKVIYVYVRMDDG
jgi:hypothetical protein